jgi:XapX domain-containing protein
MRSFAISFAVGLVVGVLYAFLRVRSPAPPLIALVGLLGMVLGERLLPAAKTLLNQLSLMWKS